MGFQRHPPRPLHRTKSLLLVFALSSTLGCDAPSLYPPSPEWISQAAQSHWVATSPDGPIDMYRFGHIQFYGDMRYSDYLAIHRQTAPYLNGRAPDFIENWELVPGPSETAAAGAWTHYDPFTGWGCTFTFVRNDGALELSAVGGSCK